MGVALSTATLTGAMRAPVQQIQTQLTQAQVELASGRRADVGLQLGARTYDAVALHGLHTRLDAFVDANASASSRLSAIQSALSLVADTAKTLQKTLVGAIAGTVTPKSLSSDASSGLSGTIGALNSDFAGQRLFAGINTDVQPLANDGAAGKEAIANAFAATFGMQPGDSAVASIAPAAMRSFLDGAFADQFTTTAWQDTWSSASATSITTRIAPAEVATTSVTANDPALRGIVQVTAMLSGLGLQNLSADTRSVVLSRAQSMLGQATGDIAGLQGSVGTMQNMVSDATEGVTRAKRFVETQIGSLEEIDPAEVSMRIASLMTQLESAYSLTGKLSQLSLVRFLP